MKKYVNGDAKWAFTPVQVTPGAKYVYTEHYRSNVPTQLIAQYTNASGVVVSNVLLKAVVLSTARKQLSVTFKVPANATSVSIFHVIKRNGYLTTDNFSLTPQETVIPLAIRIASPLSGATLSGNVLLTPQLTGTAIHGVQYKLNGNNLWAEVTVPPYALDRDTTTVNNGQYTLTAVLSNASGVTVTSAPISVSVDNVILPPPPPPPVPATNLIPNPSFEIPDSVDPTKPDQWFTTKIGDNDAAFTYLDTWKTWVKSVKVEMTTRVDGFAFYYFNPIPVDHDKTYQFKINYKSTTDAQVDAAITLSDGSIQYIYVTGLPTSADWTEKKANILMPANAVAISIYGVLFSVGQLTTDDYSLKDIGDPTGFTRGIVSLTFDDSVPSHYHPTLWLLQNHNMNATFYITTNTIDMPRGMTSGQLLSHVAAGNEIAGHTISHPHLTTLSPTELDDELKLSQQALTALTNLPVTAFASPYGEYNTTTINAIKTYYQSHRSTDDGFNSKDNLDPYNVLVQNVTVGTTLDTIKGWVDKAKAERTWLVLVYHEILDGGDLYSTTPANLEAALSYIQQTGISVQTVSQALAEVQSQ